MDGKRLSRQLREMLNEESGSNFLDSFTTYDLLNQAASKLNEKIRLITAEASLTTVADQVDYTLPANFDGLSRQDVNGRGVIRYSDGTTTYYLSEKDDDLRFRNKLQTVTSVAIPSNFAVLFDATEDSQVTGTETTGGSLVAGKSILIDSAADFSDVEAGDTIHNTTDSAMGVVLSKTNVTTLVTALFDGTNNFWTSADAYVIQPQAKYKLSLTPPPTTASQTMTVPYLKRPKPVYSDYDMFQFPIHLQDALLFYAVGFYKYRNQMQDEGNTWFAHAAKITGDNTTKVNKNLNRRRIIVNFKKKQGNY